MPDIIAKTSPLNDFQFQDDITKDQSEEGSQSKNLLPGVYVPTGQNEGIEFGVDKANQVGYIQSRNYVADTTGWRADSEGNLFASSGSFINFNIATALVAGESITAGNSVCLVNDLWQKWEGTFLAFGGAAASERQAVRIIPRQNITSSEIIARMRVVGAPADNVTIQVQTNSSGSPSGTAITNGTSNNVGGGTIGTVVQNVTFTFASAFTLTAGTTYWIVFIRSGAIDAANYYEVSAYANDYGSYDGQVYNGTTWGDSGASPYFQMTLASGTPSITVWRTDSDIEALSDFFGIAAETDTAGNTLRITLPGNVNTNQSSLTTGTLYFIGATAGALATSAGTFGKDPVALALSATSVLILQVRKKKVGTVTLTHSGGGSAGTSVTKISTPFYPSIMKVSYWARQNSAAYVYWSGSGHYDGTNNQCIIGQEYTTTAFTPETDTVLCRSYSTATKTATNSVSAGAVNESGLSLTLTFAAGAAGDGDFYISYEIYQ